MFTDMNTSSKPAPSAINPPQGLPSRVRIRIGLFIAYFGLLVFLVGARPALFNLDRSVVVGFVQISVFLIGLAIICMGGYISMMAFWRNGTRTIPAEIGTRLVSTGYVISVFSGMADVFGFGSQGRPQVPFFGPWQAAGVMVGEVVIAIGFLLLIPYGLPNKTHE
jgi:hypothetical protein